MEKLTTNGKPSGCSADDRQQDGYCWVFKDKARESEGGDVGRHGCAGARLGVCDQRVPAQRMQWPWEKVLVKKEKPAALRIS